MRRALMAAWAILVLATSAHAQRGSLEAPEAPTEATVPPAIVRAQRLVELVDVPPQSSGLPLDPLQGPRDGAVFGASFYLLRPYSENNVAYRSSSGLAGLSPQNTTTNFGWNFEPAFALWAGYTLEEGIGFRARWFHFDGYSSNPSTSLGGPKAAESALGASPFLPAVPLPPGAAAFGSPGLLLNSGLGTDSLTFSSTLRIDAADVEMTWATDYGNWMFILGGGGRYLHMDQAYQGSLTNNLADNVTRESQSLSYTRNFDGGGPVIDLQTSWRIGDSGFSLYGLGRGALLVGRTHQILAYNQSVNDPKGLTNGGFFPVVTNIGPSSITYTDNVMPTLDIEVGLEYALAVRRTRLFVRSAVVSQTYFGAGNASRSDTNLSLFGFQWSAGVNY